MRWIRKKWYKNRIRKHILKIPTLEAKQYYEIEEIMLHSMFTLLVDYVEIELASLGLISNYPTNYSWWERFKFNYITGRSIKYGLEQLEREIELDDTSNPAQSHNAKIIKELYWWWKITYPKYQEDITLEFENENFDIEKICDQQEKIEREIEQKMIQLVKLRGYLWT